MSTTKSTFNPNSKLEERALQAWLILIGVARSRGTILYGDLAVRMFRSRALRNIGKILGHIAYYCDDHDLPRLNCVVVNKSGRPGTGIPEDSDAIREEVHAHDWYDVVPPTPTELKSSYDKARKGVRR